MRPRRVAIIVVLIALVLLMGRSVHDSPRSHLVRLDVPPVEAALWFAARYPQYFTSGEAGLEAWLADLNIRDRLFVEAMAQTLVWAWVDHELQQLHEREPKALAGEVIEVVRGKTLNQLEINFDRFRETEGIELNTWVGDPMFATGVFARLVRGASNCEGQNHLAALLIETALSDSMTIEASIVGVPRHDLVCLTGPALGQPIYVDAWSNLPAFTVDPSQPADAPLLSELGDPPPPVVPGAASRAPLLASDYQHHSQAVHVELLPERDAPSMPVSLTVRAPKLDEASLARIADPRRIYLYARILHIYDDPRAADLYRFLLERHCQGRPRPRTFVCDAATLLLERVELVP